tara:strand:+ start:458 stop:634 length:177 start_codon:yes stop_codon:yes gene_type:complete
MELAPYQIYRQDGNMWLENIETEERYFEEEETPELLKMLIRFRNKYNSRICFDRLGIF